MRKAVLSAACLAGAALISTGQASGQNQAPPPAPTPAPSAAPAAEQSHTVAPGEYLWSISEALLGTGERWVEVFALNQDVLQNPNQVNAGQVLKIPTAPVPVAPELLAALSGAPGASSGSDSDSSSSRFRRGTSTRSSAGSGTSGAGTNSSSGGGSGSGYLASIRSCESGGNYGYNDGTYKGAYNFDDQTWQSVGGSGSADQASSAEQDARASQLLAQRGSSPWPNCG
jgi:LysM repeat protein